MPLWLLVVLLVAPVVIVAVVLGVVFSSVRRTMNTATGRIVLEGIELDSGPVTLTTRMRDFHAPGFSRSGLRRAPARLVLTQKRLHILQRPQRYGIFERAELEAFMVDTLDDASGVLLHLYTSSPPGASGSIDYRVRVPEVERWVEALVAAGAQRPSITNGAQ